MLLKIIATFEYADTAEIALNHIKKEFPSIKKAAIRGTEENNRNREVVFAGIAYSGYNNMGYANSFSNSAYPVSGFFRNNEEIREPMLKQECKVEIEADKDIFKLIKSRLINYGGYDFIEVIDSTK